MYHFIKQGAARGVVCRPRRGRLGPICTLISAYHISVGILALNLRHERQVQAFILQCAAPKNHLHAKRCDPWQPASANSVGTCSSDGEMLNSLSRAAQHPPSRRRVRVGVPLNEREQPVDAALTVTDDGSPDGEPGISEVA